MIRRPPRSTLSSSSAASDVYKRQIQDKEEIKQKQEVKKKETINNEATNSSVKKLTEQLSNQLGAQMFQPIQIKSTATENKQEEQMNEEINCQNDNTNDCLLYTSPSPRDKRQSRMPSSA
eukprot:TRINITY_DN3195_c0_g1_i2.p3 TRINITY_DN3195_c0_g1~~TRINITY_DN3195_c0_g1_i2.p3  ORF type:complete len:120 (-),score=81.71 TRINITY_DN3195_c0_g1_i2:14-373(-)